MKVLKWLSIADRFAKTYLDNKLAPLGINSSQHMYLLKVCAHPGILQDSLIESFYVHPSNIVRTILALEKKGFLRREPYEKDRRTCRLYPTQQALEIAAQIQDICDQTEQLLLAGLDPQQQGVFEDALLHVGQQITQALQISRVGDEFDA